MNTPEDNGTGRRPEAAKAADAYQQALACLKRREPDRARDWLQQAADGGLGAAALLLGKLYLSSEGIPPDREAAIAAFARAAVLGEPAGDYERARLLCCGLAGPQRPEDGLACLAGAARAGHAEALRVAGVMHALATAGEAGQQLAAACLIAAARAGDAIASHLAALRLHAGAGCTADPALAARLLANAATRFAVSRDTAAELGLATTPAEPGNALGPRMTPGADIPVPAWPATGPVVGRLLSEKSQVSFFPDLLSLELCDYLRLMAEPTLAPSATFDPDTGRRIRVQLRTSSDTNFLKILKDPVITLIEARLAAAAGMPIGYAEPMVILRYRPGEEYRPHFDYVHLATQDPQRRALGQRVKTLLVYLSDVGAGGGTHFPRIGAGLTVTPERGSAITFENCDPDGGPEPASLHAGLPVERGEKWTATLWFRERPVPVR